MKKDINPTPSPHGATSLAPRTYGRSELALQYFPELSKSSAWRKLKGWIALNPTLQSSLRLMGYNGRSHTFTPAQVREIIEMIGEP